MNRFYPFVALRAGHRCEYCRAPERLFNFHFEVEHIIPRSLGGAWGLINLALACTACNLFKSDYLTGLDFVTQVEVPLFQPREQVWEDHFQVEPEMGMLLGLTATGRATIDRLQMNSRLQTRARLQWIDWEAYP